ncbi:MAG: alpha/beta fold hydrolase [Proteobacteria bacterium]|nr:alpha/beta fold hydrolase [Pseudomonadota bacterium]
MESDFIRVDGAAIEYRIWPAAAAGAPDTVLLHEGLGSVSQWRDFPAALAARTQGRVIAYSRLGHGRSDLPARPRDRDYHSLEVRTVLPAILDQLRAPRPLIFGHSDGATMALLFAARWPTRVAGVMALAPHVKVEGITLAGLRRARDAFTAGRLRERLQVHHGDVDHVFRSWNDLWLDPGFRDWNIEPALRDIHCPVVAIQGVDDEYATLEQIESIGRAVPNAIVMALPGCGHAPHRERPAEVLEATARLVARIGATAEAAARPVP